MLQKHSMVAAVIGLVSIGSANAAMIAADNASDAAYNGGWTTGSNGGTGFGPWSFTRSIVGQGFIFTGKPGDNGNQSPSALNTDIDTPSTTTGRSWGIASDNGGNTAANRSFSGGALGVGQTFSINFDNGYINGGSAVGVSLVSDTGSRFTFHLTAVALTGSMGRAPGSPIPWMD
ncbi:MAG TPA: hypothetical protein VGN72_15235 [Tepidisphaeraceae bacterium]|jgi:hypothetical protein|nr:hypothetical protein [Tepidisphaeraceae bacterium]